MAADPSGNRTFILICLDVMIELSRYALETLRKDEEFILYRGRSQADGPQVLLLSPAVDYPAPDSLKRLKHEYSFREELDPAWAVRPIAVARHWDRTVLLLEDPGGVPLDQLLGRPLDLAFWLRLAIGLAVAIERLHQRGIIHKDIKPANVLVDFLTGQCWLTGFGIASRIPRERQPLEPPEFVAGTLAYMAPEQTGRMNRSIDSRSDLYALGVTLYETLTGSLPFIASDPMEWVHCHIARQPVPPNERSKDDDRVGDRRQERRKRRRLLVQRCRRRLGCPLRCKTKCQKCRLWQAA